jgi:hypothetical protein
MEKEITLRDEFAIQAFRSAMDSLKTADGKPIDIELAPELFRKMAKIVWMAADAMIATR